MLLERAVKKYPNEPQLQLLYQIGFLEAQLAEAMRNDTRTVDNFLCAIDQPIKHQ